MPNSLLLPLLLACWSRTLVRAQQEVWWLDDPINGYSERYVPSHTPSNCRDTAGYRDLQNNTCVEIVRKSYCTVTGGNGPGWSRRRDFWAWRDYYHTVWQFSLPYMREIHPPPWKHCCHCGGCDDCAGCEAPLPIWTDADVGRLASSHCARIDGELWIRAWQNVTLTPLANLTYVGRLYIDNMWAEGGPLSLDGLHNVESTGGIVYVSTLPLIRSLDGLRGLRSVGGDLVLTNLEITSLRGLENLTTITGSLRILNMTNLTSLQGLERLTLVGGTVEIEGCAELWSLRGLESLTEINGSLSLRSLTSLASLRGLDGLARIGGDLQMSSIGGKLGSLSGLGNLTGLGGSVVLQKVLGMRSFEGLEALASIGGSLLLQAKDLQVLESLRGLSGLKEVKGDLVLDGLNLKSLSGLGSLAYVGGELRLSELLKLAHARGCWSLTSVHGDVTFMSLPELQSAPFPSLTFIGADLSLYNLDVLASFEGFSNLTHVGGGLSLHALLSITSLAGFSSLSTLGARATQISSTDIMSTSLHIYRCRALASTSGLSSLAGPLPGGVFFDLLPVLEDLNGLEAVTSVGAAADARGLVFTEVGSLRSVEGLRGLREVQGILYVADAPVLTSFKGLGSLTRIGGLTLLRSAFTSLDGLSALASIEGGTASIIVEECNSLESFAGISGVRGPLPGIIELEDMEGLQSLHGLEGITSVGVVNGESIKIDALDSIRDMKGLSGLRGAINGTVQIQKCRMLESLQGLEGVTYIKELWVRKSESFATLAALSSVTTLPLRLILSELPRLRSLHGLEGLIRAHQNPWECGCPALRTQESVVQPAPGGGPGCGKGCGGPPGGGPGGGPGGRVPVPPSGTQEENNCLVKEQSLLSIDLCNGLLSIAALGRLVGLVNIITMNAPSLQSLQGLNNFSADVINVGTWSSGFCIMSTEILQIMATRKYYNRERCSSPRSVSDVGLFPAGSLSSMRKDCMACSPACGSFADGTLIECDYATGACLCPPGTRGPGCAEALPRVYVAPGQRFECSLDLVGTGDGARPRTHCDFSIALRRDLAPPGSPGPTLLAVVTEQSFKEKFFAEGRELSALGSAEQGVHYTNFSTGSPRWLNATHGEITANLRLLRRERYEPQRRSLKLFVAYAQGAVPDCILDGSLPVDGHITTAPRIWPWCKEPGAGCLDRSPEPVEAILGMAGGEVSFLRISQEVREDQELFVVILQRKGGDAGRLWAWVELDVDQSTASVGEDFFYSRQRVNWQDGEMGTKAFAVSLVNDLIWEPTETVVLRIGAVTHRHHYAANKQELRVRITDDGDGGQLQLTPPLTFLREDTANISDCLLSVSRVGGSSGSTSARVLLSDLHVCGGGTPATLDKPELAPFEADFGFVQGSGRVEWGDGDSESKCVFGGDGAPQLRVYRDHRAEPTEELCLSLTEAHGAAAVANQWSSAKIMLVDIGKGTATDKMLECDRGICRCRRGFYANDTSRPEDCIECEEGYICSGGSSREACAPGTRSIRDSQVCKECRPGKHQSSPGSSMCEVCPVGAFANSSGQSACRSCDSVWGVQGLVRVHHESPEPEDCVCPQGSYLPCPSRFCARGDRPAAGRCEPCPEGFVCGGFFEQSPPSLLGDGVSLVHGQPRLQEGFFAPLSSPYCAVRCMNGRHGYQEACPGERPPGVCGGQRRMDSRACGRCEPGFYSLGGECKPCSSSGSLWLPLAFVGLVLGLTSLTIGMNRKERLHQRNGSVALMSVASFAVFSMQFITLFEPLPVSWRMGVDKLVAFSASLSKLDLEALSPSCSFVRSDLSSYALSLAFYPFAFLICTAVLACKHCYVEKSGFQKFWPEAIHSVGAVGLTLFLSILSPIVEPFVTFQHPCPDVQSVADFPDVFTDTNEHTIFMALGVTGCVFIPVPFVALCMWATWQYPVRFARCDILFLRAFRFLFMKYTPEAYRYSLCLIMRNLVLSLAPVVMRGNTLGQFTLICTALFLHTVVQVLKWPWRIVWVNYVEMGVNIGLEHFVALGLMLMDRRMEVSVSLDFDFSDVVSVGTMAFLTTVLGVGLIWSSSRVMHPLPIRSFFIIHSREDSSVRARLLAMFLTDGVRSSNAVIASSDSFMHLDKLMELVRCQVRNVVILLSQTTLSRPALMAQIVVTVRLKRPTIVVRTSDFVPPQRLSQELPHMLTEGQSHLAGYEIDGKQLVDAVQELLDADYVQEPKHLGAKEVRVLANEVLERAVRIQRKPCARLDWSVAPRVPPTDGQRLAILAEVHDPEAVAGSVLLHSLLLQYLANQPPFLQAQSGAEPFDFQEVYGLVRPEGSQCRVVIVVLTRSLLASAEGLGLVLLAMQCFLAGQLQVVPVPLQGFCFPGRAYFEDQLPELLQRLPRLGISVSAGHAEQLCRHFLSLSAKGLSLHSSSRAMQKEAEQVLKLAEATPAAQRETLSRKTVLHDELLSEALAGSLVEWREVVEEPGSGDGKCGTTHYGAGGEWDPEKWDAGEWDPGEAPPPEGAKTDGSPHVLAHL